MKIISKAPRPAGEPGPVRVLPSDTRIVRAGKVLTLRRSAGGPEEMRSRALTGSFILPRRVRA